jgi:hypothetical protein
MSLFSAIFGKIQRASGAATGRAGDNSTLLPWHAFDSAVEHSLRMLRGVHIPVSFFALRLGAAGASAAAEAVGDALCQLGPVGRLADGSIALLYLGPRKTEPEGDAALSAMVRGRIEARLKESGWPKLATQIEFTVFHGWTDEVGHTSDLVRVLVWPRVRLRGAGAPAERPYASS